jgi:hypothetical protein
VVLAKRRLCAEHVIFGTRASSSCWSCHLLREEFLLAHIHSPSLVASPVLHMMIPPGYTSVVVEEICQPQSEDLELDIPGGYGERTIKDVVHGTILWPKRL